MPIDDYSETVVPVLHGQIGFVSSQEQTRVFVSHFHAQQVITVREFETKEEEKRRVDSMVRFLSTGKK